MADGASLIGLTVGFLDFLDFLDVWDDMWRPLALLYQRVSPPNVSNFVSYLA
jgi:hypothetical protein